MHLVDQVAVLISSKELTAIRELANTLNLLIKMNFKVYLEVHLKITSRKKFLSQNMMTLSKSIATRMKCGQTLIFHPLINHLDLLIFRWFGKELQRSFKNQASYLITLRHLTSFRENWEIAIF
jgi:hypothetical protein